MNRAQIFWKRVKEIEATIAESATFVATLDSPNDGRVAGIMPVSETSRRLAAQCLAQGTHRLATPGEITEYRAFQQRNSDLCQAQERQRAGERKLTLEGSPAFLQALRRLNEKEVL